MELLAFLPRPLETLGKKSRAGCRPCAWRGPAGDFYSRVRILSGAGRLLFAKNTPKGCGGGGAIAKMHSQESREGG